MAPWPRTGNAYPLSMPRQHLPRRSHTDVPTGQSPQTETDAFVYFLDENDRISPGDPGSLTLLEMFMDQSQGTGFLQRGRVEGPEASIVVVVVRMSQTERSRQFTGCLAALEVLRAFYGNLLFSIEEMQQVCESTPFSGTGG